MKFWRRLYVPIVILIIVILTGAFIYHNIEGWRYLDSVYFTVVTITTIGYGDFTPQTDAGKIITLFFPFIGIGLALYLFSSLEKYIFGKHLRARLKEEGRIRNFKGIRKIRVRR